MAQTEDLSVENAIADEKDQDGKPNGGDGEHQLEHTPYPTVTTTDSLDIPPRVPAVAIGHQDAQTIDDILYEPYLSELQMPSIVQLMKASLSEPYSIYTYRYFIHKWPQLCKLAMYEGECVGAIVCKLEPHHFNIRRGYIAMLAVAKDFRRKKIGSRLVDLSIQQMAEDGCDEVVLETEVTNRPALSLYQNLGFVRDKYLHQYYLNGVDAYRLKLWLRDAFSDTL